MSILLLWPSGGSRNLKVGGGPLVEKGVGAVANMH